MSAPKHAEQVARLAKLEERIAAIEVRGCDATLILAIVRIKVYLEIDRLKASMYRMPHGIEGDIVRIATQSTIEALSTILDALDEGFRSLSKKLKGEDL